MRLELSIRKMYGKVLHMLADKILCKKIHQTNVDAPKFTKGTCYKCGRHSERLFNTSLYSPGPQYMCLECLTEYYNVKVKKGIML